MLAALPSTQLQVPDITPLGMVALCSLCALGLVVLATLVALAITMPGTDSDDRPAVIRELKGLFLGFFRRGGGPPGAA